MRVPEVLLLHVQRDVVAVSSSWPLRRLCRIRRGGSAPPGTCGSSRRPCRRRAGTRAACGAGGLAGVELLDGAAQLQQRAADGRALGQPALLQRPDRGLQQPVGGLGRPPDVGVAHRADVVGLRGELRASGSARCSARRGSRRPSGPGPAPSPGRPAGPSPGPRWRRPRAAAPARTASAGSGRAGPAARARTWARSSESSRRAGRGRALEGRSAGLNLAEPAVHRGCSAPGRRGFSPGSDGGPQPGGQRRRPGPGRPPSRPPPPRPARRPPAARVRRASRRPRRTRAWPARRGRRGGRP